MRRSRTIQRPLFDVMRPDGAAWTWEVTYKVASSGYVHEAHVLARRRSDLETLVGTASCEVLLHDPLDEVLEYLAVESMLAACQPELGGDTPHRRCKFVSTSL